MIDPKNELRVVWMDWAIIGTVLFVAVALFVSGGCMNVEYNVAITGSSNSVTQPGNTTLDKDLSSLLRGGIKADPAGLLK